MGYNNPPIKWSELERKLSDRSRPGSHGDRPVTADGGDSPAWSQHRGPYVPLPARRPRHAVPYAELHVHSNFSFLDGASQPEDLVEAAVRQGLHAGADRSRRVLRRGPVRRGGHGVRAAHRVRAELSSA